MAAPLGAHSALAAGNARCRPGPSTPGPRTGCTRTQRTAGMIPSAAEVEVVEAPPGVKTPGWGLPRGTLPPDSELLEDEATYGYCVYSHADWSYAYKSVDGEFDYDATIEGTVPADLRGGILYRVGPALFERGEEPYAHMLDGDGYALRYEFDDSGGVRFRSRFVRTAEFREEEEADRVLYRGTFGTMRQGGPLANAFDLHQKNLANTNVLAWGGKLLALYEAGQPVAIDPKSLDAAGVDDLDGLLSQGMFISTGIDALDAAMGVGGQAFTAHPHVDPNEGTLVGMAWKSLVATKAVEVSLWEWDREWGERTRARHVLGACESAPHDFGVTKRWYIMIQNRLKVDPLPYVLGLKGAGQCLVSCPEEPVVVHLIPRESATTSSEPRREAVVADGPEASFEIHIAFAHDGPPLSEDADVGAADASKGDDGENADWVTIYSAGWNELAPGSFLGEWGSTDGWPFEIATSVSPDFNGIPRTMLWRYTVNTRTGAVLREPAPGCADLCIDHPHVHPGWEGRRGCRYVYASLSNCVAESGPPCGYVRIDLKTGETVKWWSGNRCFTEELVVVPKAGGTRQEDCWLLGMAIDHTEKGGRRSSLLVFDAADLAAGPVARVWLRHQIPHGLHGSYVNAAQVEAMGFK